MEENGYIVNKSKLVINRGLLVWTNRGERFVPKYPVMKLLMGKLIDLGEWVPRGGCKDWWRYESKGKMRGCDQVQEVVNIQELMAES